MPPNPFSDLTIVVVEDHDDARRYLGLFLDRLGAKVVLARNAFEGLEAIKNNHPNLVVSDITMPGMDSFGLLREIRALGKRRNLELNLAALVQKFEYHAKDRTP
jgi:CheY-like chemotaxis protein